MVNAGKETTLIVELRESFEQLAEIIVKAEKEAGTARNDMATVSVNSISVEQTKNYAATWGDVARMALSFAGTSSPNDQNNEIVIRGNSPKGVLWKIEGVEVPNPSHFSHEGATGGGLIALSTSVLANSDFYTSAFPAEYGNASSGVFDVQLRNGNNEKRETTLQVGFQGLELGTEGPFSKNSRASYLVNYRYSTLSLFEKLNLFDFGKNGAVPQYQDLAFKVNIPAKNNVLTFWGLGGKSSFKTYENLGSPDAYDISDFYATGLKHILYINKKASWENILSFSGTLKSDGHSSSKNFKSSQRFGYSFIRYSSQLNQKINSRNQIRTGIIASHLAFSLINKTISTFNNRIFEYFKVNDKGKTEYLQGYFQWKHRLSPKLDINSGFHSTYLFLNGSYSLEPRVGLKYQLNPKSQLNIGAGLHSRLEPISLYFYNKQVLADGSVKLPNKSLSIPKAQHFVLGYEIRPSKLWRINTEIYLQKHTDVGVISKDYPFKDQYPNYSLLNELDSDIILSNTFDLSSHGTGRNYGLELTIDRFLNKGFYLLSATSLFKGTFTNTDGESFTSRFSTNFVQNFLAGKEWKIGRKKRNLVGLNLRSTYAGGLRVVPFDLEKSAEAGYSVNDYSIIYDKQQLGHYFRTDFKVNLIVNAKKVTSTFSIDLNNISNHKNPQNIYYDSGTGNTATIYQLGFIPVFNYRLEF